MTEQRFANFRDRVDGRAAEDPETPDVPETPPGPEVEPDQENEPEAERDSSMTTETPLEEREDYQAGVAAGTRAANDRMNTVFAHEDAKGRETHAARLLGRSLSAEEIIAELPNFPAASSLTEEELRAAAENGGRAEMRDEMERAGTQDLGAADDPSGNTGRAKADAVWDRARETIDSNRKQKEA